MNIWCSKRKKEEKKERSTVALSRDTSLYFSLLSALKDRFFAERRTAKKRNRGENVRVLLLFLSCKIETRF